MRISNRDFLLLFGVLIAVIITLTTVAYTDWSTKETSQNSLTPKTGSLTPTRMMKDVIDRIEIMSLMR
ncbi:MAG: hypothetical protein RIB47_10655 [Cyclobacteriaceae bacterium]